MALVATVETPRSKQRHAKSGRKRGQQERHPAPMLLYRRILAFWDGIRKDHPEDWPSMIPRGAMEAHGSVIGGLYINNKITVPEAEAGRQYAILAGQYDRYFALRPREVRSASYERSYGRDDEVERRSRNGSIAVYERRARSIKKRWRRTQDKLTDEQRNALDRVCIENREPGFGELPALRSGLAILAGSMTRWEHKIRVHHESGAKLGSRGRARWINKKKARRAT